MLENAHMRSMGAALIWAPGAVVPSAHALRMMGTFFECKSRTRSNSQVEPYAKDSRLRTDFGWKMLGKSGQGLPDIMLERFLGVPAHHRRRSCPSAPELPFIGVFDLRLPINVS
jgi:hypothetical protein